MFRARAGALLSGSRLLGHGYASATGSTLEVSIAASFSAADQPGVGTRQPDTTRVVSTHLRHGYHSVPTHSAALGSYLLSPRPMWAGASQLPMAWQQHRLISHGTPVSMPVIGYPLAQTGEGISECELIQWFVNEGDTVREFDKLCEVQSDKASVEISSRFDAKVLKVHFNKGDVVKVGATLVDLEVAEGIQLPPDMVSHIVGATPAATPPTSPTPSQPSTFAPLPPPAARPAPMAAVVVAAAVSPPATTVTLAAVAAVAASGGGGGGSGGGGGGHGVLSSPAVRRLARESGLELSRVPGSGPDGRILREDVIRYLEKHEPAAAAAATAPAAATPAPAPPALPWGQPPPDTLVPVRGYRRAMIKTMTAVAALPHFHLHDEAAVDALVAVRKALATDSSLAGIKLTMLPFIIKAVSLALTDHPFLNSSLSPDGANITLHGAHNIGVAMATPHGLVVPNIKHVQRLSIAQIAREVTRLQSGAAAGRLATEDVTGGTFSVSNIGSIGGLFANPLVNAPEVAILAIGRVRQVPSVGGHSSALLAGKGAPSAAGSGHHVHHVLGMSWGADHRVVDGAGLAHACNAVKALLEHPERMLLRTA